MGDVYQNSTFKLGVFPPRKHIESLTKVTRSTTFRKTIFVYSENKKKQINVERYGIVQLWDIKTPQSSSFFRYFDYKKDMLNYTVF